MSTPQLTGKKLVTFASAPAAGLNTGCLLEVGTAAPYSLFYDNGSVLVPIDLQGDWAGRTVLDTDTSTLRSTAANDNVVYLNYAALAAFTVNTSPTFPLNKMIELIPVGTAPVTLTAGSGVTFEGLNVSGSTVTITRPVTAIQRSANVWRLIGVPNPSGVVYWKGFSGSAGYVSSGSFQAIGLTETANIGCAGGWGGYTLYIPVTGTYLCLGALRIGDSSSTINIGLGINSGSYDSPDFFWNANNTGTSYNRFTMQYANFMDFNAGDYVRLFCYADGGGTFTNASMALRLQTS